MNDSPVPAYRGRLAPSPTGLGRLFVAGRVGRLSLEVALDSAWPTTQHQSDGTSFSLDRFAGSVAGCGHGGVFAACLTGTLGALRARGDGVDVPTTPVGLFSQVGARLAATLDFAGRYFVSARVDGLIMLTTWTVTLNQTAAWTTPRVGALIGVDVGATF